MKKLNTNKDADYITNSVLVVFSAALAYTLFMMFIERSYFSSVSSVTAYIEGMKVTGIGFFAGLGLTAAGLIIMTVGIIRGDRGKKLRKAGLAAAILCAIPTLCLASIKWIFTYRTFVIFYIMVPILSALYIVYCIYQREFFVIACLAALAGVLNYFSYIAVNDTVIDLLTKLASGGLLIVYLFAVLACFYFRSTRGMFKSVRVMPEDTLYFPIMGMCAVSVAGFAINIFIGAAASLYMLFAAAALLLCFAVYYTIKLV